MLNQLEELASAFVIAEMKTDLAHDFNHILRVVKTAKELCEQERAVSEIVTPAAWLHDCFSLPKNHPDRTNSSKYAADKAVQFLSEINYPEKYLEPIHHAIVAHSFSANITPRTLEAKIVQDADRLDALGAIGIARCMQVSAKLERELYSTNDPFCQLRLPDDGKYTVDHFYKKLLLIADSVNTESAKLEAKKRTQFMLNFLKQLNLEILSNSG
ncbi:HD domain-containing protein [Spartinivicinus poritis]|uniref:HD domain-containing protein n=1 Tax=Spartinivicinus poritis TaxID=2994640 RepID=A0ABT5U6S7_9GAMM|nr:HD domain-containing protein [Spartinivicinus sp. A2-2]MDE1462067.1 HD domain-containing protein [Spartinivicinus sp. A2-2]